MNLVMRVSDQVVALDFGRVIADGRPDEVRANPRGGARLSRERRIERGDPRGRRVSRPGTVPAQALHGVDFEVEDGGVTALLGANGAGKTTILRALCGLIRRTGDIRFRGRPIGALATEDIARLGIAHVPDGRGTFTDLTVEENLRLGAYVRADRQAVRADFDRVFGLFPRLAERRRQQAGTLSGGEQQMLAIARALLMRPSLLMLDEPSFGLAPLVVAEIFRALGGDQSGRGRQPPHRRAERLARARSRRPRGADRDRRRGAERPLAARSATTTRCAAPISATNEGALEAWRVSAPPGLRPRPRRGLRDHGAGAGDDLPGDAAHQFRPGRNGDVLDLFRLEADGLRRGLTGWRSSARSSSPSSAGS